MKNRENCMNSLIYLGATIAIIGISSINTKIVLASDQQEDYLDALKNGLNIRWEKMDAADETQMTNDQFKEHRGKALDAELDYLNEYVGIEFENQEFDILAHAYIEGVEMQKSALKYYDTYQNIYDSTWQAGYIQRAIAITELYDNYGLDIEEDKLKDFRDAVDNMYSYEVVTTYETEGTESKKEIVDYISIENVEWRDESLQEAIFKCKNASSNVLNSLWLNVVQLDENGDILQTQTGYCDTSIEPGQSAYVTVYVDEKAKQIKADSYTYTDEEGNYISGIFSEKQEKMDVEELKKGSLTTKQDDNGEETEKKLEEEKLTETGEVSETEESDYSNIENEIVDNFEKTDNALAQELATSVYCLGKNKDEIENYVDLNDAEKRVDDDGEVYTFQKDLSNYKENSDGKEIWIFNQNEQLKSIVVNFSYASDPTNFEVLDSMKEIFGDYTEDADYEKGKAVYRWKKTDFNIAQVYNFNGTDSAKDDGILSLNIVFSSNNLKDLEKETEG